MNGVSIIGENIYAIKFLAISDNKNKTIWENIITEGKVKWAIKETSNINQRNKSSNIEIYNELEKKIHDCRIVSIKHFTVNFPGNYSKELTNQLQN